MAYLTLKGLNKIYPNGFHAVHNFDLEIEKGEFIVFVGSSGCGKSTTLRMIAGLENISSGEFYIDGKLVNEKSPRDRGIAMVFQSYALYPQMSVYDNLAFGLQLQGIDEDIIEGKVMKVAKILGLTDYLDRMPRALSGGQRQRVAVGRAIIRKVDVFLMHDQIEAMTLADRIVIMKEGYIQQVGTPYELYFKPANLFVAGFIGEPPMNFIKATVKNGCIDINGTKLDVSKNLGDKKAAYEGKEIYFGFRPEHIKLNDKEGDYVLPAVVELTEMLGDNTNVYINIGDVNAILKVNPHEAPKVDTDICFSISQEYTYLFDAETEKVING